jgi:hypothetical protein
VNLPDFIKKIHSLKILKKEGIEESVPYRPPTLYSLKSNIKDIVEII